MVVDAGHGDRDWGAIGPEGLSEKVLNLDIATRVRELMLRSNSVDWTTGTVTEGSDIPAFGTVWLTRPPEGPLGGQYEAGLAFRAELANSAGADVLVSVHNNTVPKVDSDFPGTQVLYSVGNEDSARLGALLYEEVLRSMSAFEADWSAGDLVGAIARYNPDTGEDYYGLLRRATMPSAIVEGLYLSEPEEEALLATEEVKQAYAEGVYRGVVRFLTTDDAGTGLEASRPVPGGAHPHRHVRLCRARPVVNAPHSLARAPQCRGRAMALCGLLALAASGCTGASAIEERGGGGATAEPIAPLPSVTVAAAGPTTTTMAPEPTGPPRPVADAPRSDATGAPAGHRARLLRPGDRGRGQRRGGVAARQEWRAGGHHPRGGRPPRARPERRRGVDPGAHHV